MHTFACARVLLKEKSISMQILSLVDWTSPNSAYTLERAIQIAIRIMGTTYHFTFVDHNQEAP